MGGGEYGYFGYFLELHIPTSEHNNSQLELMQSNMQYHDGECPQVVEQKN